MVSSIVACCRKPGTIDLFVGDEQGVIWHRPGRVDEATSQLVWSSWVQLGRPPMPGTVAPSADWLSVTSSGTDRIELFVRAGTTVYQRRFDGSIWTPSWAPRTLPDNTVTSGFATAATNPDDLHIVYTVGAEIVHWRLKDNARIRLQGAPSRRLRAIPISGGFELFVTNPANLPGSRYRRMRYTGSWATPSDLDGLPLGDRPFSDTFAASANQLILAPGRDQRLWIRTVATALWRDMGGIITTDGDRHDILAAAATSSTRTDIFALWAPAGVVHRRYDSGLGDLHDPRAWSPWQLVDAWTGPLAGYTLLRPDDLLHVHVRDSGFRRGVNAQGVPELTAEENARLDVNFPPQHMGEEASETSQARSAGPSRLRFKIPRHTVIPLSVQGVLEAMTARELRPPEGQPDSGSVLELPWRLLMALPSGGRCAPAPLPVESTGGVTGLWHCQVLNRGGGPVVSLRPFRAIHRQNTFQKTPLGAGNETVDSIVERAAQLPVTADRLILSSLGAWFSLTAEFGGTSELKWSHRAAMGRDYYVRVVKSGRLFPLGHRAVHIVTIERVFKPDMLGEQTSRPAALQEKHTLVVTEPVRDFGGGEGGNHERAFPFQQVSFAGQLTWEVDGPPEEKMFWPQQYGDPIYFALILRAGRETVEATLPLLFVADGTPAGAQKLDDEYKQGPPNVPGRPEAGIDRAIPLLVTPGANGYEPVSDSIQHVLTAEFGIAQASNGTHPKLSQLKVALPALQELLGAKAPTGIRATLSAQVLSDPNATVLLDLVDTPKIDFAEAGAATGAVATPTMPAVNGVARDRGPIVKPPSGKPYPSPAALFSDDATLLGVIKLNKLIQAVTDQPAITWRNGAARLQWTQQLSGAAARPIDPFVPGPTSTLALASGPDETKGRVTDFSLHIPDRARQVVVIELNEVAFTSRSAGPTARPTVTVDVRKVSLDGALRFVQTLQSFMLKSGGGPAVSVSPTAVAVRYVATVPAVSVGVFSLTNLAIEAGVTLSLVNKPLTVDFKFATRQRPFLVTVSGLGGGGYLELAVAAGGQPDGLTKLVGGIEFGASVAVDFAIVAAEVHVFGGIVFVYDRRVSITGYLRIGGSIDLLGLARVAVELTLSLTYTPNRLEGSAKLVVVIDLTLWSASFELTCRKSFAGPDMFAPERAAIAAPPASSVAATLGPVGKSYPWRTYCRAFAGE
ncbi:MULTISPECIES: hypothetical protein [Nocardia]|uniref:hypothetical protein n=1 Tax=Nocardia TaxID=1817 RepID=UPI0013568355|nr:MULTISPECIES: hypothetical protein [Nocardia]